GCADLGVSRVAVDVSGPGSASLEEACSYFQVVLSDLAPGTYTARLRPLGAGGELLTRAPVEQTFVVATGEATVTINVPPEAWAGERTGTFYFRTRWGGADCADAAPAVAWQRLTLSQGGQP